MEVLEYDLIEEDSKRSIKIAINRKIGEKIDGKQWIPQGSLLINSRSYGTEYIQAMVLVSKEKGKVF